ncbi:MAG TPA: fumarylacetoacetate hydrolase family protein [Acidimicrobiales bacterium]|nr:fumarylacetoacetate hydrolase family protein [Acidimicrobiales bacterium]
MRIANFQGRATIVLDKGLIDVETASRARFPSSLDQLLGQLDAVRDWFDSDEPALTSDLTPDQLERDARLGPVVTRPSQIFAIGLNYRTHALEMHLTPPVKPMVFTKFPSSLAGANASFAIPSPHTDWEAELVVVMGATGRDVSVEKALSYVAGYCVGQDLSDRDLQMVGTPAQFSLGKSYRNFSPIGPWLTTTDEVADPNDLRITCSVNGQPYQDSTTHDMVFRVAELVSFVSSVCELRPGDLMFTGSPHGVGQGQTPPVFLSVGDVVETSIDKLGSMRNAAVAAL